ncbi:acyltransferase family protein [Halomonas alkaliantarctica]|nr:acyltransferase family protein [Halomonas alkaliantarctica]
MAVHVQGSRTKRNTGLDFVRCIAIGLVLLAHGTQLVKGHLPDLPRRLVLYLGGYLGVELFFVLSGFLIGTILMGLFNAYPGQPPWRALVTFWQRRWWRTLPTYFLALVLSLTLFSLWFDSSPFDWRHFFFVQNIAHADFTLMPETWSISVEEWFYLTLPLALSGIVGFSSPSRSQRDTLLIGLLTYLVLFTALRWGWVLTQDPHWDKGVRKTVLWRLDAIAWGCLMAWLAYYHTAWLVRQRARLAMVGGALAFAGTLWLTYALIHESFSVWLKGAMFTLVSAGLAMCLPAVAANGQRLLPARWLRTSVTHVSLVSYSLYLFHRSAVIPFMQQPWIAQHLSGWVAFAAYIMLSLLLATLVYYAFERPMTHQRERFSAR